MEKAKALGLFRMRVTGALDVFRLHGMYIHIPETVAEIERLAIQLVEDLKEATDGA